MSYFNFNKIFILESLTPNELQTGTELEKRINQWAPQQGIDCQVVLFPVHSMQEWEIAWNGIYTSIEKMCNLPIIHLEMHGNKNNIGIDSGTNGTISLTEVFKKIQKANVLSQNSIFLSLAVCMGLNIIRSLKVYEPMPFCGVLGSLETLQNDELLENYTIFYKSFLKTLSLDKAEQAMKDAGVNADKYELFKPEQVFMNSYLGYLETYKTDQQIREKAVEAACSADIVFNNAEEKQHFIRDYKCTLLLTENKEYQRAVDTFFMFNLYPNNRERFTIPQDIYNFKDFVAKQGVDWVLSKRPLSDEDIKGLSIQMLNEVDEFCSKNKLSYSLAYGTLLGAVRHKGFIPWDDDIDILMLRDDYEKFLIEFNKRGDDTFTVASNITDTSFHFPFAKVVCNATINDELGYTRYGHSIDIFPIDKIPPQKKKAEALVKKQRRYWNLYIIKSLKWDANRSLFKNLLMSILKIGALFVPYTFLNKHMLKNATSYRFIDGDYSLGCLCAVYGVREIMPKSVFSNFITLPFEGRYYSCIADFDRYLSNIYKDYMKLPPKEKQVTHHAFKVYWK